MSEVEFFALCDVAYPWVPPAAPKTIDIPGELYDREAGRRAIAEIGDTARLVERLGFDGGLVTEQHGGSVGLVSNAMVAATWMAASTTALKIAAVGPLLNGYMTPIRLAEEIALVDNLSGGRLIVGLPMGIGSQYHAYGVTDPSVARGRYREAHDLLLDALRRPGPFAWEGDHFDVPYVNVWPKPIQEPCPEVWIPAAGSRESLGLAAERGHTYMQVLVPRGQQRRNSALFRELCQQSGYEPSANQIAWVGSVYVAETDEQARLEFEAVQSWIYQTLHLSFQDSFPPGHVSTGSLRGLLTHGGYRVGDEEPAAMTWEKAIEERWLIAGSPATVTARLEEVVTELGAGRVVLDAACMPMWMKEKSLTLMAEHVLPAFRPDGGHPAWRRTAASGARRTVSEHAAASTVTSRPRLVDLGARGRLDVRLGHVAEAQGPATSEAGNGAEHE